MSLKDRAKATAKNIEGKVQEAVGNRDWRSQSSGRGQGKTGRGKSSSHY